MKVGLYFGSFNPVHFGHLSIANYFLEFTDLEQLWFIVSPQNPLKKKASLLADYHRLELLNIAIGDSNKYKVSNIEFSMPKPSYTIDTLSYLQEKYSNNEFVLIMGSDNLPTLQKWKNYKEILDNYYIYVYPRPNNDGGEFKNHNKINFYDAPLMEISSSFIRKSIKDNKDIRFFLPLNVYEYIKEMHFYEK